jgi:hypothetical protein
MKKYLIVLIPMLVLPLCLAFAGCGGDPKLTINDLQITSWISDDNELVVRIKSNCVVINGGFKVVFKNAGGDIIRLEERTFIMPNLLYVSPLGFDFYFDNTDARIESCQVVEVFGEKQIDGTEQNWLQKNWWIIIVSIALAAIMGGITTFCVYQTKRRHAPINALTAPAAPDILQQITPKNTTNVYCTNCGQKLGKDCKFCNVCGQPVKKGE